MPLSLLLAQEQPAAPPGGPGAPAGPGLIGTLFPFLLIGLVFWFLLIRPQQKQEKARQARVNALKRGDKVRTRGGIVATVIRVKDDEVILGIGSDKGVELAVHKGFVDEVYGDAKPDAGKGK